MRCTYHVKSVVRPVHFLVLPHMRINMLLDSGVRDVHHMIYISSAQMRNIRHARWHKVCCISHVKSVVTWPPAGTYHILIVRIWEIDDKQDRKDVLVIIRFILDTFISAWRNLSTTSGSRIHMFNNGGSYCTVLNTRSYYFYIICQLVTKVVTVQRI